MFGAEGGGGQEALVNSEKEVSLTSSTRPPRGGCPTCPKALRSPLCSPLPGHMGNPTHTLPETVCLYPGSSRPAVKRLGGGQGVHHSPSPEVGQRGRSPSQVFPLHSCSLHIRAPTPPPAPPNIHISSQTLMHPRISWGRQMQAPRLPSRAPASFNAGPRICIGTSPSRWV